MPSLTGQAFERIANKAVAALQWAIVVGIAYTLASLATFFVNDPLADSPRPSAEPAPAAPQRHQQSAPADLEAISQANLFGKAPAEDDQAAASEPAVETRLPLNLLGVFVAEEAPASAAVIAEKGKAGRLYGIGESVPGNATLSTVQADHVVLLRSGALETLRFPRMKEFERRKVARELPPAKIAAPAKTPPNARDFIAAYQERLAARPEQVQQLLDGLAAAAVGGGGYRVGDLSSQPYLSRTGLQPGDLILSLNGLAVGDLNADQLALKELLAAGEVRIEVQRGERRFFLTAALNP